MHKQTQEVIRIEFIQQKNGFAGSGLNCPKGTRLYNLDKPCPIFFDPVDVRPGEIFEMITPQVAPDILPYYAVSNYGRVLNTYSGKIMKPNYRPNGYEYYCLAASNCKNGQKKYNVHRIVMMTFCPVPGMENMQVNHINGDKTQNYYMIPDPNGILISNLEWVYPVENIRHSRETGLNRGRCMLDFKRAQHIRELHDQGFSYNQIGQIYNYVSAGTIQNICQNVTYRDPNYVSKNINGCLSQQGKLDFQKATEIRRLRDQGYSYEEIRQMGFDYVSLSAIQDVCRNVTFHDPNYIPKYKQQQLDPANSPTIKPKHCPNFDPIDRAIIIGLYKQGYSVEKIKESKFPNHPLTMIYDIVKNIIL